MGADMALFPEAWLHNYTYPDVDFTLPKDELYKNSNYAEWAGKAVDRDSDSIRSFCSLAEELQIGIAVTGFTKGREYPRNTVFIINRAGEVIMEYSKVHTCDFDVEALCESGDEFRVCEFDGIRLGAMICYDREYPESARVLMLKGAEIILVPNDCHFDPFRLEQLSVRAAENMAAVAMANEPGKGLGCSCAFSPVVFDRDGKYINNRILVCDETEQIAIAEINMAELRDYRRREMWGNTYRKVYAYGDILSTEVKEPFIRPHYRR